MPTPPYSIIFGRAEDPYLALTAQTLNADGTPKRPMNAFMIFARKRRPQISAANQMMRTGDISKILSKEWNSMEMASQARPATYPDAMLTSCVGGQEVLSRSGKETQG